MSSKLVCRKCGGSHLTIKCGKEKKKIILDNDNKEKKQQKTFKNTNRITKHRNTKKINVKISNLPEDVTLKEMTELIQPWGSIDKINFSKGMNFNCYVDFYYRDEAEYFVKALDKTPFEYNLISVMILN